MFWVLQILVYAIVGKTIGFYFRPHCCPPCHAFIKQLLEAYKQLMTSRGGCFEVSLVSTDIDQKEFDLNVSGMLWLALPFQDRTRQHLCRIFNIQAIPALLWLDQMGNPLPQMGRALSPSMVQKLSHSLSQVLQR